MRIILLGSPGVGKGTYGTGMSAQLGIPLISMGELLRQEVSTGRGLGAQAKKIMDKGELLPDEIALGLLKKRLSEADCKKGYILDGFPRTVNQAHAFSDADVVVNFVATEETILDRLAYRITCKQCGTIFHLKNRLPKREGICDNCGGALYQRDDQKPEVVKERLRIYYENAGGVIEFYKNKGMLLTVQADGTWEPIIAATIKVVKEFLSKSRR